MVDTIYCGSTSPELDGVRQLLIDQIRAAGLNAVMLTGAEQQDRARLQERMQARMQQADVFVAVMSYQRGMQPAGMAGKSLLEVEYDLARQMGKPITMLMPQQQTGADSAMRQRSMMQAPEHRRAQKDFMGRVQAESQVLHFADEAELTRLVVEKLSQWAAPEQSKVTQPHRKVSPDEELVERIAERTAQKVLAAQQHTQADMAQQALRYLEAMRLKPGELVFGPPLPGSQFRGDMFTIMPFAAEFDPVYRGVIKPLAGDLQLRCLRGDEFSSTRGSIIEEVWAALNGCRFAVADISGSNLNVFYELGIAHTLNKPAILITQAQTPEEVPFDIRHMRYIQYRSDERGLARLRDDLDVAIKWLLADIEENW